jgi:hypothetical protein
MVAVEKKIDQVEATEKVSDRTESQNLTDDLMRPLAVDGDVTHADASSPARDLQARLEAEVAKPQSKSWRHMLMTVLTVCLASSVAGLVLTTSG